MHRQRKKDLNLKINRSLDKRSSRGMIYENEELRMRTIAINEDVDRSQNDVKKLKKENDQLKREIWGLRDEYEKLEQMLKKVCVQANYDHSEFQPLSGYNPNRRISVGGDTLMTSAYDSEEEDCGSNILMIDEDGDYDYDPGACPEDGSQETVLPLAVPEEDSSLENTANVPLYQNQHRMQMWSHSHHHSPELEMVREESENNSNSIHNSSLCNTPSPLAPIIVEVGEEHLLETNENQRQLISPSGFTPLIEITPASSPVSHAHTNTRSPEETGARSGNAPNNEIQDMGCVTSVPKTFQVTSELRISNNEDTNGTGIVKDETQTDSALENEGDKTITAINTAERSTAGAAALPPPSPGTKLKSIMTTKVKQRKIPGLRQSFANNKHSSSDTTNMAVVPNHSCENPTQVQTMCRKHCPRRNSLVFVHGTASRGGGSANGSPILGLSDCCPDFYSCYQSEPSLNSVGISPDEYFCASPIVVSNAFNGFDQSVCLCRSHISTLPHRQPQGQPNWNSIDKNVAIGVLEEDNIELAAQEVIDELEKQFDPTLENIAGVRMMPGRIFICLRTGDGVKRILEKESFKIKGQKMKVYDASKRFSTIVLSGIPPDLSDFPVISTLNQFGQVVAPLERRIYKGVDISERICHMYLVKSLQPVLSIAGYEVRAKIVSQCQELPLSAENEKQELPSTHTNSTHLSRPVEITSKNTSPRTLRSPRPLLTSRNPQTVSDPIQNQNPGTSQPQHQQSHQVPQPKPQPQKSDISQSEVNHRLSLPLPPTKPHVPILQSNSTPTHLQSHCQTLQAHKQVVRSSSSAPRLESATDPATVAIVGESGLNASILAKRQMSISVPEGNASAEEHTPRTSLGVNNNLPPNPKKPLSRLMKSSPGSLLPQSIGGFRRGSNVSMQMLHRTGSGELGSSPTIESANNNNPNVFPSGVNSGRSRMFLHNQSQMSHQSSIPLKRGGTQNKSFKKEQPLPWCGCWGNGCI